MNQINYGLVTAEFMEIGPQKAADFLLKNISNRRIDKTRVAKYVYEMTNGQWRFNGDAIRFDVNGNLIDGQHRLTAIIKTGRSFCFLVIKNIETDSKKTIDTGKGRTASDVLAMFSDVKPTEAATISAAISRLVLYEKGLSLTSGGGNAVFTGTSFVEEYYINHMSEIQDSLRFTSSITDHYAMLIKRSDALFLHIIFSRISRSMADNFMYKIITGAGIDEKSNEFLVRGILTKRAMKTIKSSHEDIIYTVIKAWNRNIRGGVYSNENNLRYYKTRDESVPFAIYN